MICHQIIRTCSPVSSRFIHPQIRPEFQWYDVVYGQRLSHFPAVGAGEPVSNQNILFAEGHSAAVNTSHNFYQNKNRRSTEYLFNALDDSVRFTVSRIGTEPMTSGVKICCSAG
jgi:hypothetical protein